MKVPALLFAVGIFALPTHAQMLEPDNDALKSVAFLEGKWEGEGSGLGGFARVEHTYEMIIQDTFLQMKTMSMFVPADSSKPSELHEDMAIFSFDADKKKIKLRQFLSEGFVNTYVLSETNGDTLAFSSESTEGAGGMQARLTFVKISAAQYYLELALAPPGKPFFSCRKMTMHRIH